MSVSVRVAALGLAFAAVAALARAQAPPPGFTADQAKRGQALYLGACSMCHGDSLDDGQFAPPLKGPPHLAYWQGKTAEDVLNYMIANMPPTQPGSLGPQTYADVMAFMLQSAGQAPGDKELPADPAALRGAAPAR
jgi:mono/diheme cytochrome c family protein